MKEKRGEIRVGEKSGLIDDRSAERRGWKKGKKEEKSTAGKAVGGLFIGARAGL